MKSDIFELIKKMNRMIKRLSAVTRKDNQNRGQGRTLHLIMENNGISPKELAGILDIRPSSLTVKLDKLEADGNIRRIRDRHDARIVRLYITNKGKESVAQRLKEKDNRNDFFNGFSTEEKEIFCTLSEKFCAEIETMIKKAENKKNRAALAALIELDEESQIGENPAAGGRLE